MAKTIISSSPHPQDFWSADIDNGAGLLLTHPSNPALYILNHSAAYLWNLLKSRIPPTDLPQHLATHFHIPLPQATADVAATLHSWSQTLLAPIPPTTPPPSLPPTTDQPCQHVFKFSLNGQPFQLLSSNPDFAAEIRPRLAHLLQHAASPNSSPTHTFRVTRTPNGAAHASKRLLHSPPEPESNPTFHVYSQNTLLGSVPDPASARVLLLPEIGRLALHPSADHPPPDHLAILHAAALAHPITNQAILLAAPTGAGKTTLTAALAHAGKLRLLSDDSSAITTTHPHQVLSLPFALMLRQGSWPILHQYYPEIQTLPLDTRYGDPVRYLSPPQTSTQPAIPKCLVFTQYNAALQSINTKRFSHLESFYELQKSSFWVNHTEAAITEFTRWLSSLPSYQLQYSELSEAIAFLQELLWS